jgi:hypothetical protein
MAGMKMTTAEICKVIGGGRGANGEVGKPLSPKTLYRYFKKELEAGPSLLRAKITGNFYRALEEGAPWATQFGLRNRFGWHTGTGIAPPLTALGDDEREPIMAQVTFVVPGFSGSKREVEVEPRPIEGQKLLPAPEPMFRDAVGVWRPLRRTE